MNYCPKMGYLPSGGVAPISVVLLNPQGFCIFYENTKYPKKIHAMKKFAFHYVIMKQPQNQRKKYYNIHS